METIYIINIMFTILLDQSIFCNTIFVTLYKPHLFNEQLYSRQIVERSTPKH